MSPHLNLPVDGETALASAIGDDLVLIAGVGDALPETVPVLINADPSLCMAATVMTWSRADAPEEAATGFLAAVPLTLAKRLRVSSIVMRGGGHPARYALMRPAVPVADLVRAVQEDAGAAFAEVADGLVRALMGGRGGTKRVAAALAVLKAGAAADGFVEVTGALDTGEVFLQGWAADLPEDQARVLVVQGGQASFGDFRAASVRRDDLGDAGRGFAGLLDTGGQAADPAAFERVFFRGRSGWRALEMYDRRLALGPTDVPAHIRDVLPRAQAAPETLRRLRRAADRFDGRDTVSLTRKPVRLGIDMAVEMPGGGMLVSGWLLDPGANVTAAILRAGSGGVALDGTWTRLPRPDVTTSFQNDDLFRGRLDPDRNDHGFMAFAPGLSTENDAPVYLELSLGEDETVFHPLKSARGLSRRALERLVAGLDPRSATAALVVERQIGPMMQACDHPAPRTVEIRDYGFDETARTALVVGAGGDPEEAVVALTLLALDPETKAAAIVVSAPAEAYARLAGEVERLARFYRLKVRLVASEGVNDACDAYQAAVEATSAETLVFLAAGVLPRRAGWLSRLERAYQARGGRAMVSPTIVFEDDSIRFAGTWIEGEGAERRLVDRFIGYPRDAVRDAEPTEVAAGSLQCCAVSRQAFEAAGGFTRSYLGAADKGRDLCLKLKLSGTPSVWLPEVEMIAADEEGGRPSPLRRLAQRVDRWCFDRRWSLLVANMRGM